MYPGNHQYGYGPPPPHPPGPPMYMPQEPRYPPWPPPNRPMTSYPMPHGFPPPPQQYQGYGPPQVNLGTQQNQHAEFQHQRLGQPLLNAGTPVNPNVQVGQSAWPPDFQNIRSVPGFNLGPNNYNQSPSLNRNPENFSPSLHQNMFSYAQTFLPGSSGVGQIGGNVNQSNTIANAAQESQLTKSGPIPSMNPSSGSKPLFASKVSEAQNKPEFIVPVFSTVSTAAAQQQLLSANTTTTKKVVNDVTVIVKSVTSNSYANSTDLVATNPVSETFSENSCGGLTAVAPKCAETSRMSSGNFASNTQEKYMMQMDEYQTNDSNTCPSHDRDDATNDNVHVSVVSWLNTNVKSSGNVGAAADSSQIQKFLEEGDSSSRQETFVKSVQQSMERGLLALTDNKLGMMQSSEKNRYMSRRDSFNSSPSSTTKTESSVEESPILYRAGGERSNRRQQIKRHQNSPFSPLSTCTSSSGQGRGRGKLNRHWGAPGPGACYDDDDVFDYQGSGDQSWNSNQPRQRARKRNFLDQPPPIPHFHGKKSPKPTDEDTQETIYRKVVSFIRAQGVISVQSPEIIEIFKSLTSLQREYIMKRGTLHNFLKECPYLGCYGSKFFVREDGQNPVRVDEDEPLSTGYDHAFPGYRGGYGDCGDIQFSDEEDDESPTNQADTSTLLRKDSENTNKQDVDTENGFFLKYLEKVRITPPRVKSSGDKSYEQFVSRLDQIGIKVGEADDDDGEAGDEDDNQDLVLTPERGMFQKFLSNLKKSGIKVELKKDVEADASPAAEWSQGYDDPTSRLVFDPPIKAEEEVDVEAENTYCNALAEESDMVPAENGLCEELDNLAVADNVVIDNDVNNPGEKIRVQVVEYTDADDNDVGDNDNEGDDEVYVSDDEDGALFAELADDDDAEVGVDVDPRAEGKPDAPDDENRATDQSHTMTIRTEPEADDEAVAVGGVDDSVGVLDAVKKEAGTDTVIEAETEAVTETGGENGFQFAAELGAIRDAIHDVGDQSKESHVPERINNILGKIDDLKHAIENPAPEYICDMLENFKDCIIEDESCCEGRNLSYELGRLSIISEVLVSSTNVDAGNKGLVLEAVAEANGESGCELFDEIGAIRDAILDVGDPSKDSDVPGRINCILARIDDLKHAAENRLRTPKHVIDVIENFKDFIIEAEACGEGQNLSSELEHLLRLKETIFVSSAKQGLDDKSEQAVPSDLKDMQCSGESVKKTAFKVDSPVFVPGKPSLKDLKVSTCISKTTSLKIDSPVFVPGTPITPPPDACTKFTLESPEFVPKSSKPLSVSSPLTKDAAPSPVPLLKSTSLPFVVGKPVSTPAVKSASESTLAQPQPLPATVEVPQPTVPSLPPTGSMHPQVFVPPPPTNMSPGPVPNHVFKSQPQSTPGASQVQMFTLSGPPVSYFGPGAQSSQGSTNMPSQVFSPPMSNTNSGLVSNQVYVSVPQSTQAVGPPVVYHAPGTVPSRAPVFTQVHVQGSQMGSGPSPFPGPVCVPQIGSAPQTAPGTQMVPGPQMVQRPPMMSGAQMVPGHQMVLGPQMVPGPQVGPGPQMVPGPQVGPGPQVVPGPHMVPGSQMVPGPQVGPGPPPCSVPGCVPVRWPGPATPTQLPGSMQTQFLGPRPPPSPAGPHMQLVSGPVPPVCSPGASPSYISSPLPPPHSPTVPTSNVVPVHLSPVPAQNTCKPHLSRVGHSPSPKPVDKEPGSMEAHLRSGQAAAKALSDKALCFQKPLDSESKPIASRLNSAPPPKSVTKDPATGPTFAAATKAAGTESSPFRTRSDSDMPIGRPARHCDHRDSECQTDSQDTQDACVATHRIKITEVSSQTVPPVMCDVMINTLNDEELDLLMPAVETADVGTNTKGPKMKDKAVLTRIMAENLTSSTSTQTKIQMVSSSLYGKALARALMAEERVLELEASKCISDLTRSKCDVSMNYQQEQAMLCLSQEEKGGMDKNHQKALANIDSEIIRIQNLHLENLRRLRDGEALAKLPPITVTMKPAHPNHDPMTTVTEQDSVEKTQNIPKTSEIEIEQDSTLEDHLHNSSLQSAPTDSLEELKEPTGPLIPRPEATQITPSEAAQMEKPKPTRPPGLDTVPEPLAENEMAEMEKYVNNTMPSAPPAPSATTSSVDPVVLQQLVTMQILQQYPMLGNDPQLLQTFVFQQMSAIMQMQHDQQIQASAPETFGAQAPAETSWVQASVSVTLGVQPSAPETFGVQPSDSETFGVQPSAADLEEIPEKHDTPLSKNMEKTCSNASPSNLEKSPKESLQRSQTVASSAVPDSWEDTHARPDSRTSNRKSSASSKSLETVTGSSESLGRKSPSLESSRPSSTQSARSSVSKEQPKPVSSLLKGGNSSFKSGFYCAKTAHSQAPSDSGDSKFSRKSSAGLSTSLARRVAGDGNDSKTKYSKQDSVPSCQAGLSGDGLARGSAISRTQSSQDPASGYGYAFQPSEDWDEEWDSSVGHIDIPTFSKVNCGGRFKAKSVSQVVDEAVTVGLSKADTKPPKTRGRRGRKSGSTSSREDVMSSQTSLNSFNETKTPSDVASVSSANQTLDAFDNVKKISSDSNSTLTPASQPSCWNNFGDVKKTSSISASYSASVSSNQTTRDAVDNVKKSKSDSASRSTPASQPSCWNNFGDVKKTSSISGSNSASVSSNQTTQDAFDNVKNSKSDSASRSTPASQPSCWNNFGDVKKTSSPSAGMATSDPLTVAETRSESTSVISSKYKAGALDSFGENHDPFEPKFKPPESFMPPSDLKDTISTGEALNITTLTPEKKEAEWQQVTKKKRGSDSTNKESSTAGKSSKTKKGSAGTKNAESGKSNNFERLVTTLQNALPDVSRDGVIKLIKEVRTHHGGLKGLTLNDIIEEAVELSKEPASYQATDYASAIQIKTPTKTEPKESSTLQTLGKFPTKKEPKPDAAQPSVPARAPPKHLAAALNALDDDDDLDNMCVICHDSLKSFGTKTLDCGHTYHDMCIKKWVYSVERTCPTCRSHALFPEEFPRLA